MIKNYTSGVPVERTLMRIEEALVKGGAMNISKDYKDGALVAVCFAVLNPQSGQRLAVRLPVNADGVYQAMRSAIKRPRSGTLSKLQDQAIRTAWKLIQDWVEVQMSLIAMQQADFLQVFLPYVWDGKKTFYTALKDQGFKMLTAGNHDSRT